MNVKKLFFAAMLALATASAGATTYAVWPTATEGQEQIPNEFNGWWNISAAEESIDGVSAMKCSPAAASSDAAAGGWLTLGSNNFDYSLLALKDLVFDAQIVGQGQWNVRLTADGVESDVTISIPADGAFHTVRYNVQKGWPGVYEKWLAKGANGKNVFTFALSGTSLSAESAIYFTNCRYEDAIPMPSAEPAVSDVTTTSATLTYNVSFPDGYTNTVVTVNGEPVEGASMQLSGLTPKTQYSYTIVASGEYNGETYTAEKTVTFTTSREEGDLPVWYGVTDKEGFTAEYSITYNPDKTLTVNALIETEKETPVADRNFHIYIGGNEWLKLYDDGSGVLAGTTTSTFEEGTTITWEWYLPREGGVYQESNTYVVGSENEAPLAIRVKASAQNVTFSGAEIAYDVTAPEGKTYKVFYKLGDAEAVEATANPIVFNGLTEKTEYSCEVYAVLTDGETTLESKHVTVTFKTPAENAYDRIYADLFNAEFKNAYLIGDDETMRRSFFVTLPWSVVYNADGTAVYSIDLGQVKDIVGLNPQIYWNGFKQLTLNSETGRYEYNFGAQEVDAETAISHYFAYNGGGVDVRTPYTKWGMEMTAPEIGEATELTLSASNTMVKVGEKVLLSAVAKDAQGHYLPADDVDYNVTGEDYTFDGAIMVLTGAKGERTVTATMGSLSSSVVIRAIASEEAENRASGLKGFTDEAYIQGGAVENVTDADRNSQLEWKCDETQEHYFILDLANGDDSSDGFYVEAIDVYFEGAYATKFSVTLSSQAPAELGVNAAVDGRAAATEDVVFQNTKNDTQHFFTQDPTASHRYVTLRTSEALNTGWGIKLRDMKVYATVNKPSSETTGVEEVAVADENAEVIYYNLNGVRVANPENGLYIRRQGNKVSKVFVK